MTSELPEIAAAPGTDAAPGDTDLSVAVSVGTDHHPFPRLMDWLESWHARNPRARLTVQHGSTRRCRDATNVHMLAPAEVVALYERSDVVVLQGGPGGIMDARRVGKVPIVVPRVAKLDEVVDDHQVVFARHLAQAGLVEVADTEAELHALLDTHRRTHDESPAGVAEGVKAAIAALSRPYTPLSARAAWRRRRWVPWEILKALHVV